MSKQPKQINVDDIKINVPYQVQVGEKIKMSILARPNFYQDFSRITVTLLKSELDFYMAKYTKERRDPQVLPPAPKIKTAKK
jgi:hypothetical protein